MHFLAPLILAMAISFDGLGVGFTCGVRGLSIPWFSLLVISISSALALLVAMFIGGIMADFFSAELSSWLGGIILILLGGYMIKENLKGKDTCREIEISKKRKANSICGLLKDPERADVDSSGSICVREAAVLGAALAMDAFGAGIGAALTSYPPFTTGILTGLCKIIFLSGGVYAGKLYTQVFSDKNVSWVAGGAMVILGLISII